MPLKSIDGSLGFLMNKGSLVFQRELNRNFNSSGYDITYEQWSTLMYLLHSDGNSQNEMAEKTHRDKVSITKIIDNLEKRDLVLRKQDNNDRRIKRIFITKSGKKLVPNLKSIAEKTLNEAFSDIKKKDLDSFKNVLSSIVENLTGQDLLEFVNINKGRWK